MSFLARIGCVGRCPRLLQVTRLDIEFFTPAVGFVGPSRKEAVENRNTGHDYGNITLDMVQTILDVVRPVFDNSGPDNGLNGQTKLGCANSSDTEAQS